MIHHDTQAALDRLMRFLSIEGVTGEEKAIAEDVAKALQEAGVPAEAIAYDDANTRIPVPTQTGNLIVKIPGRGALGNAEPIMFMTHLDTVPLCAGAKPRITGDKIVSGGDTRSAATTAPAAPCSSRSRPTRQAEPRPSAAGSRLLRARGERPLGRAPHQSRDARPVSMGFNYDGSRPADVSSPARSAAMAGRWRSSAAPPMPASRRSAAFPPAWSPPWRWPTRRPMAGSARW